MIRFLNLKNQICAGEPSFAFYDTIPDKIIQFSGEQVFGDMDHFLYCYNNSKYSKDKGTTFTLKRFTNLIPEDFFKT